jgi:hypothetical protein
VRPAVAGRISLRPLKIAKASFRTPEIPFYNSKDLPFGIREMSDI